MRKQHFARLDLERYEELVLPNMIWGPVSPHSFLTDSASERPSLVGPQSSSQGRNQTHVHIPSLLDTGQPPPSLPSARSAVIAHSDAQTPNSASSTRNSISFSAADDLSDPVISDFFGIDLLVALRGRAPSFLGRDSSGISATTGIASHTAADGTGPSSPAPNAGLFGGFIASSAASMPLSNNAAGPATLLLPPANSPSAVLRGSPKGAPVSPLAGPTYGSGPNILGGTLTLVAPQFVPVNADDDNGSMPVTNGIPPKRDFNVAPMQANDQDLKQATLTAVGLPAGGTWSSLINTPGNGMIALWKDQMKTAPWQLPGPGQQGTFTFYIEGVHESSALNDVKLTFDYTVGNPPNQTIYSASASMTITPLIQTFGVTPNADAGDPSGQNVIFYKGTDANKGLAANTPSAAPGALFKGVALIAAMRGDMAFIQNIMGLDNGHNGTKNNAGARVGWLFANGTSANWGLKAGNFAVLDINAGDPDQTYAHAFNSQLSPDGNTLTITANDSPITGIPNNANQGIWEDVQFQARLFLVWRWIQNVGGNNVTVFYPLAYTNWQVNFYAKGLGGIPPIDWILILNGVSSDGSNTYKPSNDPPPALDMTKIFNGNNQWK